MKTCNWCKEEKPLTEFYPRRGTYYGHCKECHKKYYQKHYKNRTEWIRELKSKPCMDCGNSYHFAAMQFDHRPGEIKSFDISRAIAGNIGDEFYIQEEINKCDLVCANCHAVRSWNRLQEKHKLQVRILPALP